jgi:hypothetical protein
MVAEDCSSDHSLGEGMTAGPMSSSTMNLSAILAGLTPRQREIAEATIEWGYSPLSAITRRPHLWKGRTVLDIGMGGAAFGIPFLLAGAAGYVGVDPVIGTMKVRDFRHDKDKAIPLWHTFPYSPMEMMAAFPNLHLYSAKIEDACDAVKQHSPGFITLTSVTEHLSDLESAMAIAHASTAQDCLISIVHANYYSWTGHHKSPRGVEEWLREEKDPDGVTDWRHLEPDHPCYSDPNLNRVRLRDFRDLVDKYFQIYEWRVDVLALDRLTPEIRHRWKKYTLEELLGRTIRLCGVRRERPLDNSLEGRQLHHPDLRYLEGADYSSEDMEPLNQSNYVYFSGNNLLFSQGYNDQQGARIMARLSSGDRLQLEKFPHLVECTVKTVKERPVGACVEIEGEMPSSVLFRNYNEWTIAAIAKGERPAGSRCDLRPTVSLVAGELSSVFRSAAV